MGYQNRRKPLFPMEKDGQVVLADKDCEKALLEQGYKRAEKGTAPTSGPGEPVSKGSEGPAIDVEALSELTKDQLKDLLHANGLDVSGNKPELIERLASNGIGPKAE